MCLVNRSCVGAVLVGTTCFQLATAVSFYDATGFSSWSRIPVPHTDGPPGGGWAPSDGLIPGVNATGCTQTTLRGVAIDYDPKPAALFGIATPEGRLGITLHMHGCASMLVEDVTIHAAPYMAVTSFNGEGGHVLRRLQYVANAPGQVWVSERDGIHESDVRRGLTLEDSHVFGNRDDFFNIHSTLLVVMRCDGDACLVINPHVEGGALDTTYATNSLLSGARNGDNLTFVPLVLNNQTAPSRLVPLATAVLKSAKRVTDNATLDTAVKFADALHAANPSGTRGYYGTMAFCGHGHAVDVWKMSLQDPLGVSISPGSLISVDSIRSEGAIVRNNTFNMSLGSMRFKSSNSLIVGNSAANEGCGINGCKGGGIEVSYLQCWFEGGAFVDNVTVVSTRSTLSKASHAHVAS